MTLDEFARLLSVAKDSVVTLATVLAAIVGVRGFNAWRRELTGKAKYESAKRLLRSTYRVRDALASAFGFLKFSKLGPNEIWEAYESYQQRIDSCLEDFQAELLEAEVTFGESPKRNPHVLGLKLLNHELRQAMYERHGEDTSDVSEDIRALLAGKFAERLGSSVSEIERIVRPHLGR